MRERLFASGRNCLKGLQSAVGKLDVQCFPYAMPDNVHYLAFLNDPDQASREMELKIFLEPQCGALHTGLSGPASRCQR